MNLNKAPLSWSVSCMKIQTLQATTRWSKSTKTISLNLSLKWWMKRKNISNSKRSRSRYAPNWKSNSASVSSRRKSASKTKKSSNLLISSRRKWTLLRLKARDLKLKLQTCENASMRQRLKLNCTSSTGNANSKATKIAKVASMKKLRNC